MSPTRWVVLVACLVCQMGLGLGGYIFAVFLKPIVADLGWSRTTFSASSLSLLLAMSLGSPLIGSLIERVSPRIVFSSSITLVALSLWLLSVMETVWQFYAIGFLLGLAMTGLGDIPAGAVVSRWFEKNRGFALGLVYIGSNIGGAIVPLAANAVAEQSSWRTALRVLSVGGWLLIFPFAFWGVRSGGGKVEATAMKDPAAAPVENDPSLDLPEALRTPSFWILAAVIFSFYFYYIGVNNHLVAFLSDSGFSDAEAARRFAASVAVGVVGKIGTGLLADRVPRRTAMLFVFALMTAGSFLPLGVARAPLLVPVFLVIHGFTVAAENVVLPLMIVDCFGLRHMARIFGTIMLVLLPSGAAGPVFAGYSFDTSGSYQFAFTCFACVNVAAVGSLFFVQPLAANRARRDQSSVRRETSS